MGKFNIVVSDTYRELMDFTSQVIHDGMPKAQLILQYFEKEAYNYLDLPETLNLPAEQLVSLCKQKKKTIDKELISFVGVDQYKKMINEFKEKNSNTDFEYMEQLLEEYLQEQEDK